MRSCVFILISLGRAADPNFLNFREGRVIHRVRRAERATRVARGTHRVGGSFVRVRWLLILVVSGPSISSCVVTCRPRCFVVPRYDIPVALVADVCRIVASCSSIRVSIRGYLVRAYVRRFRCSACFGVGAFVLGSVCIVISVALCSGRVARCRRSIRAFVGVRRRWADYSRS